MNIRKKYYPVVLLLLLTLTLDSTAVHAAKGKSNSEDDKYSLSVTSADISVDESFTLSLDGTADEEVSFVSDDDSIVSVRQSDTEPSCECTGISVGKTTVTVKIREKKFLFFSKMTSLTCRVTVAPAANSVRFTKKTLKLTEGTKKKLAVTIRPSISIEVPEYTSSNPEVAAVNTAGLVVAKKAGTAVITATIKNKNSASCKIVVTEAK